MKWLQKPIVLYILAVGWVWLGYKFLHGSDWLELCVAILSLAYLFGQYKQPKQSDK